MHSSAGNGSGRYLVTDFRNSVIAKRNSDGTLTQIDYNAWGAPSYTGDLEGLSVLWNGYYYDDETGNYYLRNRFYSPQERSFITEDPRGINPSRNWNNRFAVYAQYDDGYGLMVYAKSDPVNGRDDWGLMYSSPTGGFGFDPSNPAAPNGYVPSPGHGSTPMYGGGEIHFFIGYGRTIVACKNHKGCARLMLFSKKCVGGAIGFGIGGGPVFGMNGKRCDPSYYEGWFYEAGFSAGVVGGGGDIGYDGLDLSGTVEVDGGIGKSFGIKWKSTWCYYKFLRYL